MAGHLYIISGASGSGKTTLLNSLCPKATGVCDPQLRTIRAPKYSERAVRPARDGVVDDIIRVDHIGLGEFDICYVINGVKYGIRLDEISRLVKDDMNLVIILSDFRVVRQVRDALGACVRTVYLSSAIDADRLRRIQLERLGFQPSAEEKAILSYHFERISASARLGWWNLVSDCVSDLEQDWRAYAKDAKSTEIRAQRIRAFHTRYIDQLSTFDHVVLNYTEDAPDEMHRQMKNVIAESDTFARRRSHRPPALFVVAGASGAGKGTLLEMLYDIGSDRIHVTSKLAKRPYKKEDRRDGMIALWRSPEAPEPDWPAWWTDDMVTVAKKGEFPEAYDLRWRFHVGPGDDEQSSGTWYAVSRAEIERNLELGLPQIFVSNMGQFIRFRELWPDHVVFVYLHRLSSEHEDREYQMRKWAGNRAEAERRLAEKRKVHEEYIRQIAEFDHVLLNTTFEEDLYDQMVQLVEHHSGHVGLAR